MGLPWKHILRETREQLESRRGKADLTLIAGRKELRILHHSCSVVFEAERKCAGASDWTVETFNKLLRDTR